MNILEKILNKISKKDLVFLRDNIEKTLFFSSGRKSQVRMHWDARYKGAGPYLSPWVPSKDDVLLYEQYIESLPYVPKKALILGSTVKLRKMLSGLGIPYIVADQSSTMLMRTAHFLNEEMVGKEMWVKSNWLDLPFQNEYFDVVLGDLVFMQFLSDEQDNFLSKVKNLLSEKGVFITRVHTVDSKVSKDVREIIKDVIEEESNEDIMMNRIMAQLFEKCGDLTSGRVNHLKAIELLKKYKPETQIEDIVVKRAIEHWSWSYLDYSFQDERDVLNRFGQHFSLVERKHVDDYKEAEWYPVIRAYR